MDKIKKNIHVCTTNIFQKINLNKIDSKMFFFNNLNWDYPFYHNLCKNIVLRVFFYIIIYNFLAQNEHRNPVTSSVEKRNNSFSS